MSDRLEEIKRDIVNNAGSWDIIDSDDVIWLMSELEQSWAEVERLNALPAFIRNSTPGG